MGDKVTWWAAVNGSLIALAAASSLSCAPAKCRYGQKRGKCSKVMEHSDAGSTDAGKDAGHISDDSGAPVDGGSHPDANHHEPDAGRGPGPTTCGASQQVCDDKTPVCSAGKCVECTAQDTHACAAGKTCDSSGQCVVNKSVELDCAHLPTNGECAGGPRKVLLATASSGLIGMFDPIDGHFWGYFKHPTRPEESTFGRLLHATQGPDQCIWTAGSIKGIERYNTNGTFKDVILPKQTFFDSDDDVIESASEISFSRDSVFVATGDGYVKFIRSNLGKDPEQISFTRMLRDEWLCSLVPFEDDSVLVSSCSRETIDYVPSNGGARVPLLKMWTRQVVRTPGDVILATSSSENSTIYTVELGTGTTKRIGPIYQQTGRQFHGIAPLQNGRWLVTTTGDQVVVALDPGAETPGEELPALWNDPAVYMNDHDFHWIGQACLPADFVESRAVDPAVDVDHCNDLPTGPVLFSEDFESGVVQGEVGQKHFNGLAQRQSGGGDFSIEETTAANGSRSLKLDGGVDDFQSLLGHDFSAGVRPSYIGYYVRFASATTAAGYFSLNPTSSAALETVAVHEGTLGSFRSSSALQKTLTTNTWARIQLRDIDWEQRTYDLYVDCERLGNDINFDVNGGPSLQSIELFNYSKAATSWFDEIVVK